MIEPEIAFADLSDDMDCAESYIKFTIEFLLKNNMEDLKFLSQYNKKELVPYLESLIAQPFARCSYTDAIKLLQTAIKKGKVFRDSEENNDVHFGIDLATEHEKFLAEKVFKRPVCVYDYPKEIKAFYMKLNADNRTVAAFDVLAP